MFAVDKAQDHVKVLLYGGKCMWIMVIRGFEQTEKESSREQANKPKPEFSSLFQSLGR